MFPCGQARETLVTRAQELRSEARPPCSRAQIVSRECSQRRKFRAAVSDILLHQPCCALLLALSPTDCILWTLALQVPSIAITTHVSFWSLSVHPLHLRVCALGACGGWVFSRAAWRDAALWDPCPRVELLSHIHIIHSSYSDVCLWGRAVARAPPPLPWRTAHTTQRERSVFSRAAWRDAAPIPPSLLRAGHSMLALLHSPFGPVCTLYWRHTGRVIMFRPRSGCLRGHSTTSSQSTDVCPPFASLAAVACTRSGVSGAQISVPLLRI